MIEIKITQEADAVVLALLGRQTYAESHGHFITEKNDLLKYLDTYYSVAQIRQDLANPNQLHYIVYVNELPVGYAKIVLNAKHESVNSIHNGRLERIYILSDFISLKLGQQLLSFVEAQAKTLKLDTLWLSVYIENKRAIRFYEKNEFENIGELNFMVNGKPYENMVFSKKILA